MSNLNGWDYAMLGVGALGVYYAVRHAGISRYAGIGLAAFAGYYVYTDYAAS